MQKFRRHAVDILSGLLPLQTEQIAEDMEKPPDPGMGDFAFPCFKLSREFKMAPDKIAQELAAKINILPYFEKVEAKGPYLNFFCSRSLLAEAVLEEIKEKGERYGESSAGAGKTVVIDFSAPNIAKPFGVGHLRSTVIGNSLYRIHHALGYNCVGVNHLGDWGTQFGKLIVAYRKWGEEERLARNAIVYLYELYVRFHKEAESNPALEEEARTWFRRLEEGDKEAGRLWRLFRQLSLKEFKRIYALLGVSFDSYDGESFYNDMLDDTIREAEEKGLAKISQGALIMELGDDLPPMLLRKQDGATLYATRDLCAAIYRHRRYGFEKMLYVVGSDQALHFRQLFAALQAMGYDWSKKCEHVPFGLIRFKEGKMSTRKGTLIFLEEVLDKSTELAGEIIREKNPELVNKEEVARQVGIGAVIFGDLGNDRVKNIEFDWDKVLDFSGETAPYIQYAHARICSILRKADDAPSRLTASCLISDAEQAVISSLARYPEIVSRAAEQYRPSVIGRYLVELARDFNGFYHQCPVLQAEKDVRTARLALIDAVRQVLLNGLYLLGIEAPVEM